MAIISQGMNLDADTISGNPPTTHRTKVAFLPFFTKAPEYIGNALKSPETAWASSRVLPIFWTRILSHDSNNPQDGSDSTASICRAHVGSWACGLLAGVSLLAIAFAGCTLIVLVALCTYNKVTLQLRSTGMMGHISCKASWI